MAKKALLTTDDGIYHKVKKGFLTDDNAVCAYYQNRYGSSNNIDKNQSDSQAKPDIFVQADISQTD